MQLRRVRNAKDVSIAELFDNPEIYEGVYCTVRGVVAAKNSFSSTTLPEMDVVYSKYVTQRFSQFRALLRSETQINYNDFFLTENLGPDAAVAANHLRIELENDTKVLQPNMIHESNGIIDSSWLAFIKYGVSIIVTILTRFSFNVEMSERI